MKSKKITAIEEIESVNSGEALNVTFEVDGGEFLTLEFDHVTLGEFISQMSASAQLAEAQRPKTTPSGNHIPLRYQLAQHDGIAAFPHNNETILAVQLSPGLRCDYRLQNEGAREVARQLLVAAQVADDTNKPSKH